jgi:hypothetical protein
VAGRVAADALQRGGDLLAAQVRVHPDVGGDKHLSRPEVDGLQARHALDARGSREPLAQLPHLAVGDRLVGEQLPVAAGEPDRDVAEHQPDHDRCDRVGRRRPGRAVQHQRDERERGQQRP